LLAPSNHKVNRHLNLWLEPNTNNGFFYNKRKKTAMETIISEKQNEKGYEKHEE